MRLHLKALAIVAMVAGVPAFAGDEGNCAKRYTHCANCPHCGEVCYPTVSRDKKTKHCWKVESKTICIPKVRFPWEKKCNEKSCCEKECALPKCGRKKCVKVLMKHEYECTVCKYSWNPAPCGCEQGKDGGDFAPPPPASNRDIPPTPPEEARRQVRPPEQKVIYGYEERL